MWNGIWELLENSTSLVYVNEAPVYRRLNVTCEKSLSDGKECDLLLWYAPAPPGVGASNIWCIGLTRDLGLRKCFAFLGLESSLVAPPYEINRQRWFYSQGLGSSTPFSDGNFFHWNKDARLQPIADYPDYLRVEGVPFNDKSNFCNPNGIFLKQFDSFVNGRPVYKRLHALGNRISFYDLSCYLVWGWALRIKMFVWGIGQEHEIRSNTLSAYIPSLNGMPFDIVGSSDTSSKAYESTVQPQEWVYRLPGKLLYNSSSSVRVFRKDPSVCFMGTPSKAGFLFDDGVTGDEVCRHMCTFGRLAEKMDGVEPDQSFVVRSTTETCGVWQYYNDFDIRLEFDNCSATTPYLSHIICMGDSRISTPSDQADVCAEWLCDECAGACDIQCASGCDPSTAPGCRIWRACIAASGNGHAGLISSTAKIVQHSAGMTALTIAQFNESCDTTCEMHGLDCNESQMLALSAIVTASDQSFTDFMSGTAFCTF